MGAEKRAGKQQAKKGAGGAKADPLAFSHSLDAVLSDANHIQEAVTFSIRDGNQFWFVLPDGILPANPEADVSVPYLRFTVEGRRAVMLARMMFSRDNGAVVDPSGRRVLIEFRPCILLKRSAEGLASVQRVDELEQTTGAGSAASPPPTPPPTPAPEPEGDRVPDIGELLEGLQQTRKSLDTIDTLLAVPDALITEDEGKRQALQETIAATKDKALIGLGQLGDVLARGVEQSLEEWRAGVSKALNATIEAMVAFDDLADHVRDDKRRELEALRQSIESYFATIDPQLDMEACRRFSTGVNEVILQERKVTLEIKHEKLEKHVEQGYDAVIVALQQALGKGTSLPLIPHPAVEPAQGFMARLVLNMVHIVMAARYGGLSIKLDTERFPRLHSELRGWDATRTPRVHIIERRRFAALRSLNGSKSGLATFE